MKKIFLIFALLETSCFGMEIYIENELKHDDTVEQNEENFVKGLVNRLSDFNVEYYRSYKPRLTYLIRDFQISVKIAWQKINQELNYTPESPTKNIISNLKSISDHSWEYFFQFANDRDGKLHNLELFNFDGLVELFISKTENDIYAEQRLRKYFFGIYPYTVQYLLESSNISSMDDFDKKIKQITKLKDILAFNIDFIRNVFITVVKNIINSVECHHSKYYLGNKTRDINDMLLIPKTLGVVIGNLVINNLEQLNSENYYTFHNENNYKIDQNSYFAKKCVKKDSFIDEFLDMLVAKCSCETCKFNIVIKYVKRYGTCLKNLYDVRAFIINQDNNYIIDKKIMDYLEMIPLERQTLKNKDRFAITEELSFIICKPNYEPYIDSLNAYYNYFDRLNINNLIEYYNKNLKYVTDQQEKEKNIKKVMQKLQYENNALKNENEKLTNQNNMLISNNNKLKGINKRLQDEVIITTRKAKEVKMFVTVQMKILKEAIRQDEEKKRKDAIERLEANIRILEEENRKLREEKREILENLQQNNIQQPHKE